MKIKYPFLLICGACILCACSAQSISSESLSPSIQENQDEFSSGSASLSLVTSYLGSDSKAVGQNGFYQIFPNTQGGCNILYSDYDSLTTVYLCSAANCLHNNDPVPHG